LTQPRRRRLDRVRAYAGLLQAYGISSCAQLPLSGVETTASHDYLSNKPITPSWTGSIPTPSTARS
jgi:hypothetical protein